MLPVVLATATAAHSNTHRTAKIVRIRICILDPLRIENHAE
jgi:hypothetical protein